MQHSVVFGAFLREEAMYLRHTRSRTTKSDISDILNIEGNLHASRQREGLN